MASMLRTKLSLKAEKNWHQNKPANRRARNKEASMAKGGSEAAGSSLRVFNDVQGWLPGSLVSKGILLFHVQRWPKVIDCDQLPELGKN
jgi:hypothetical protein